MQTLPLLALALVLGVLLGWLLRPPTPASAKTAAADADIIRQLRVELHDTRRRCMECEARNARLRYELRTAASRNAVRESA